jgi:predicted O-methyltransferase YrrM
MREYLYALTHNEELETTILPIADGVALSAKRQKKEIINEK